MKKLLFVMVAMVAMSFAACGGHTDAPATVNDSDTVVVDTVDTVSVDSVCVL